MSRLAMYPISKCTNFYMYVNTTPMSILRCWPEFHGTIAVIVGRTGTNNDAGHSKS